MTELPSGVKLGTANLEKIDWYWQKIKDFDRLFSDDIRWDEECFFEKMYAPDTVFFETENGLLLLTGLREGMYAAAHITFWDHKLLPRVRMIKDLLTYCFIRYDLLRIEALIPEFSRALKRFMEKRLGFVYEGRMRDRIIYMGNPADILIYSLLRREVL